MEETKDVVNSGVENLLMEAKLFRDVIGVANQDEYDKMRNVINKLGLEKKYIDFIKYAKAYERGYKPKQEDTSLEYVSLLLHNFLENVMTQDPYEAFDTARLFKQNGAVHLLCYWKPLSSYLDEFEPMACKVKGGASSRQGIGVVLFRQLFVEALKKSLTMSPDDSPFTLADQLVRNSIPIIEEMSGQKFNKLLKEEGIEPMQGMKCLYKCVAYAGDKEIEEDGVKRIVKQFKIYEHPTRGIASWYIRRGWLSLLKGICAETYNSLT